MKCKSPLDFTENHRFTVYRDFSLSPLQFKMLTGAYQPMIGAVSAGLYSLLLQQLPADRSGYSTLEQQRKLFRGLDLEPNETGRKLMAESMSRLEAAGLLQSFRLENVQSEEDMYEYRLYPPLGPSEFFQTQHLALLLRDKIGEHALQSLRGGMLSDMPKELNDPYLISSDQSSSFVEVFTLGANSVIPAAGAPLRDSLPRPDLAADRPLPAVRFRFEDMIRRFPKHSHNRQHVEKLEGREDAIARINYYADKYGLTLKELCQLLDEDGVFDIRGDFAEQEFERKAHAVFLQRHKREESRNWGLIEQLDIGKTETAAAYSGEAAADMDAPVQDDGFEVPEPLKSRFDFVAYNRLLSSDPYTKVLQLYIGENVSAPTLQLFSKLNLYYRIPDAVLNALIHHMRVCNLPWKEAYIEKMAASLQGERIMTYKQAVDYFRKEREAREGRRESQSSASGSTESRTIGKNPAKRTAARNGGSSGRQKPKLPVYRPTGPSETLTAEEEEEFERLVRQLEKN